MLGFYIHYFQVGIGFIMTGVGAAILFVEGLVKELEKNRQQERERKREEERERETQREREREQNGRNKRTRKK
jgi:hypothetical protein